MKLPVSFVPHHDHRVTVLLSFTVRRDSGYFGPDHGETKQLGAVYRASLEGSGIMLRMLLEFLGLKADQSKPGMLKSSDKRDTILGHRQLAHISAVDYTTLDMPTTQFLARMHDEASKRTAHPKFDVFTLGLDPDDLRKATVWVIKQLWAKCYDPDPLTLHGDLYRLLSGGKWEGIPFKPPQ